MLPKPFVFLTSLGSFWARPHARARPSGRARLRIHPVPELDPFVWPWCPRAVPAVWRAVRGGEALHGDDKYLGAALEAYAEYGELFAVADDLGELDLEARFAARGSPSSLSS